MKIALKNGMQKTQVKLQKDLSQFKLEIFEALAVIPFVSWQIVSDAKVTKLKVLAIKRSKFHYPPTKNSYIDRRYDSLEHSVLLW